MIDLKDILIIVLLLLNFICFILGYLLNKTMRCRYVIDDESNNVSNYQYNKHDKFNTIEKIDIDTTKVITKIKTDDLEKKYSQLGETSTTNENISNSIEKLKKLKD